MVPVGEKPTVNNFQYPGTENRINGKSTCIMGLI